MNAKVSNKPSVSKKPRPTGKTSSSKTSAAPTKPTPAGPSARQAAGITARDPERTMRDIVAVATQEFSEKGLAGARIDAIAQAMQTSKRMIYYYFGSKEGLYLHVLEEWYKKIRAKEADLHLQNLPPQEALQTLVRFTVENHFANPGFVRMVMNENIHHAAFLAQSKSAQSINRPAIETLRNIYERGVAQGVFRKGLDPLQLHLSISALSFFNVSNRATLALIFKHDIGAQRNFAQRRDHIVDLIMRGATAETKTKRH
jgi:AcrR family transcriptional regulator